MQHLTTPTPRVLEEHLGVVALVFWGPPTLAALVLALGSSTHTDELWAHIKDRPQDYTGESQCTSGWVDVSTGSGHTSTGAECCNPLPTALRVPCYPGINTLPIVWSPVGPSLSPPLISPPTE